MKLKLCLLAMMSVLAACEPVPKETLRLDMETVRVEQQREHLRLALLPVPEPDERNGHV